MHFEELGDAVAVAVDGSVGVAAGFDAVGDAVVVGIEIEVVGNPVAIRIAAALDAIGNAVAIAVELWEVGWGSQLRCRPGWWLGSACP